MGVIYRTGDDVAELLVPFVQARKPVGRDEIERHYRAASVGGISSSDFWRNVGLEDSVEDEYLDGHGLTPGLLEFLQEVSGITASVWCLSNDVSEWSRKLRARLGITDRFSGFVISGDVGLRKPDRRIYERFITIAGVTPSEAVFVDDRPKNLLAAAQLGFRPVLFGSLEASDRSGLLQAVGFEGLLNVIKRLSVR
jgi:putative hydrolase of the HAD superfamily